MRKMGSKKGFTLVELALAVGFIGILSLTITLIINDTVATYRRGLTLNQVNTTGMDLVDDFRSAIQGSPSQEPSLECEALYTGDVNDSSSAAGQCKGDGATSLVYLQRVAAVDVDADSSTPAAEGIPVYGVICTGAYSYIWNSGYFFGENAGEEGANGLVNNKRIQTPNVEKAKFTYNGGVKENFRLLKIKDEQRGVCKNAIWRARVESDKGARASYYRASSYYNNMLSNDFNVTENEEDANNGYINYFAQFNAEQDTEVVLDDTATNPLALYDLTITVPTTNPTGETSFYAASFILGTLTGGINVKAKGNFCKTPEDYEQDFDYCAINKFNFAAQAKGG